MTYWQIMTLFKGGKGWGFCPKMQGLGTGRNAFRWTDFWFKRPDFGNLGRFWLIRGPCFFVFLFQGSTKELLKRHQFPYKFGLFAGILFPAFSSFTQLLF